MSDNSVTNSNNNSKSSDASSIECNRNTYLSGLAALSRENQMSRRSILMSPKSRKKSGTDLSLNHQRNSTKIDLDDDSLSSDPQKKRSSARDKISRKADPHPTRHPSLIPFSRDDSINHSEITGVWQTITSISMFGAQAPAVTSSSAAKIQNRDHGHLESKKKSKVDKTGQSSNWDGSKRAHKNGNSVNSSRSSSSSGDPFLVSDYNECDDQYSDFNSDDDLGSMHSGDDCAGKGDGKVGYEKALARTSRVVKALARGRAESTDNRDKESKRSHSLSEDSADMAGGYQSADNPLDDKAKEKSRYHAKNTRMRKKNYIESIREKVKLLSLEREQALSTRKQIYNRMLEDLAMCRSHLSVFLRLMLEGETSPEIWHHIVEPHMLLIMPVTPYRSFQPAQLRDGRRHIFGAKELSAESCSFSVFVQSIGDTLDDGGVVLADYDIDESSIVFENNVLMCKFFMETTNAVSRGAKKEVCNYGMIYAKFSSQNKIQYMEMSFDVWAIMHDLRLSSGRHDMHFVPNTLALASCDAPDMRIVVSAIQPHNLLYASPTWIEQTGHSALKVEKLTVVDVVNIAYPGKSKGQGSPGGNATLAAMRMVAAGCATMHQCTLQGPQLAARFSVRLFPLVHSEEARETDYVLLVFRPIRETVNYMCIELV